MLKVGRPLWWKGNNIWRLTIRYHSLQLYSAFSLIPFLTLKQMPPNLAAFPKIYLATMWYDIFYAKQWDVSMATVFWQVCFWKFWFSCIFNQNLPKSWYRSPQAFLSAVGHLERLWGNGIKYLFFWSAVSCNDLLFCARNPGALSFHCPRVSPGDQLLTKRPEDSGIEIGISSFSL